MYLWDYSCSSQAKKTLASEKNASNWIDEEKSPHSPYFHLSKTVLVWWRDCCIASAVAELFSVGRQVGDQFVIPRRKNRHHLVISRSKVAKAECLVGTFMEELAAVKNVVELEQHLVGGSDFHREAEIKSWSVHDFAVDCVVLVKQLQRYLPWIILR